MERIATCLCEKLSVRCTAEPLKISLCHCNVCQKRTGSVYGIVAFFRRDDADVQGAATAFTQHPEHEQHVTYHFCPECGSTVFWHPSWMPELIGVGVGSFADASFPAPTQQMNHEARHPWVSIPHLDRAPS